MLRKQCLEVIRSLTNDYTLQGTSKYSGLLKPRDIPSLVCCHTELYTVTKKMLDMAKTTNGDLNELQQDFNFFNN